MDVEIVTGKTGVADRLRPSEGVRDGTTLESGGLRSSLEPHAMHVDALRRCGDARLSAGCESDGCRRAGLEHSDDIDGVGELVRVQDPAGFAWHVGAVTLREVEQVNLVCCGHRFAACLVPADVVLAELEIGLVREARDVH